MKKSSSSPGKQYAAKGGTYKKDHNNATVAAGNGPTPLISAMRCYVAFKLGDEVDVPDELCRPSDDTA